MKHITKISLSLIVLTTYSKNEFQEKQPAFINKVIANCYLQELSQFFETIDQHTYQKTKYSGSGNNNGIFTRINQLPYNTPVEIHEIKGDEIKISAFLKHGLHENSHECWVHVNDLEPITENNKSEHPHHDPFKTDQNIVTLVEPTTLEGIIYSGGTRFVTTEKDSDKYVIVGTLTKEKSTSIPKSSCIEEKIAENSDTLRTNILNILHHLTSDPEKTIPFAFGGNTFLRYVTPENFIKTTTEKDKKDQEFSVWDQKERTENEIASGFDAPHFITYVLNLSGKPANSANSLHLLHSLPSLEPHEEIKNGYIIAYKGGAGFLEIHEDKSITLYIAIGYDYGYGSVIKAPIHTIYKDIHTVEDLQKALENNTPLQLLKKDGAPTASKITTFKILRTEI